VYSGRRLPVARAPVRNADFITDHAGTVRLAAGFGTDNVAKLYYRAGQDADQDAEWQLINDSGVTQLGEWPIGFSADDKTAYLLAEQPDGPNAIVAFDIATGERKPVLRDKHADPHRMIYRNGTAMPIGAVFMDGKPRSAFLDGAQPASPRLPLNA
jgi:hypothetical protein